MKLYLFSVLLIAVLALATACSHVPGGASDAEAAPTAQPDSAQQPPPFSAQAADKDVRSSSSPVPGKRTSVPAGTPISVRLQSAISSSSARSGDTFDAVLDEPLVVGGETVAGRGTQVTGRVIAARSSGHLNNSGYLRLTLVSIDLGGKAIPVQTSSVSVQGAAHKKRNLAMIGGGAGAGALIGALAGGGKGALIGSAVGAGAGTAGAYATGKKDVGFAVERRLTFRLTEPLNTRG